MPVHDRAQPLPKVDRDCVVAGVGRSVGKLGWHSHRGLHDVERQGLRPLDGFLQSLDFSEQHHDRFAHRTALRFGGPAESLGPCSQFVFLALIHLPVFAETISGRRELPPAGSLYRHQRPRQQPPNQRAVGQPAAPTTSTSHGGNVKS
jgi:hypothetical protein